jgi:outer membrane protein TolC
VRWTRWVTAWGLTVLAPATWATAPASPTSPSEDAARERVLATVEAAMDHWTEARAMLQDASAGEARARAEGGAGSPFVAWTSEGVDGSLSRTANAQDTLHFGLPFNWPGQGSAGRDYADAAAEAAELKRATVGVRVALDAGMLWVERAAWIERAAVRRARLARIDRALNLHEARYQLGEVSGSEVMQLDLEHVRESSQVAVAEAEAASRLERHSCG